MNTDALEQTVLKDVGEHGLVVVDGILSMEVFQALRLEALEAYREGEFHKASIGKGIEKQRIQEVRGDHVMWLDKSLASASLLQYWELVDRLRAALSDYFRVHLERTELHYAVYPKGAFYAPHFDQFQGSANRIFSVVLYLNEGWQEGDGGELHACVDGAWKKIAPLMGRLVIFRSDAIEHEVLLTEKTRISLTGWMRRDSFLY